jgi:hypothetical protein
VLAVKLQRRNCFHGPNYDTLLFSRAKFSDVIGFVGHIRRRRCVGGPRFET